MGRGSVLTGALAPAAVALAAMLAGCGSNHALPPEQNSLAQRIDPRPGRALVYVHGDASAGKPGPGLVVLAATEDAPASLPGNVTAKARPAKLKVFNTTFTLIDAPEGVVRLMVEPEGTAPAGEPFSLHVESGKKYYVLVNPPGTGKDEAPSPEFILENAAEGAQSILPSKLSGYVRFAAPGAPAEASATAQPANCSAPCS